MRSSPTRRRLRIKAYRLPARASKDARSKDRGSHGNDWRGRLDVENLAKVLAVIAASFYVLGLLSVNGYLFQVGVSDFALVRARFVYTGVLLTLVGLFAGFPVYLSALTMATWRFFKRQHRRRFESWSLSRRATAAIIMFVGFPLSGVFLSLWMLSIIPWPSLAGMSDTSSKIVWSLVLIVCAVVAGLMGIGGLWATLSLRRSLLDLPSSIVNGIAVLGWIAVVLAFCIWVGVFMIAAYPSIPEQFGGGKARSVQLLLEEDAVEGAKELGIPVIYGKRLSVPVDLIYDGSETYVIELDSGRIVQLDKGMVTGIANSQRILTN